MNEIAFVTGAPGWLGTKLATALAQNRRKVRCFVLQGSATSSLQQSGVEVVEGDLTNKFTIKNDYLKGVKTIFHCAGIIHPTFFRARDFYKINRDGLRNLLEKAIEAGVKKFIYVSSNAAAGINSSPDILITESHPAKPYTSYGKSKWEAEQIIRKFQMQGKIETVIIRPCWFYGPGQPSRMNSFMKMIQTGRPLLFGDGNNLRSMTYVDDLVRALLLVEKKAVANGKTYWIADERAYTTNEIYGIIAEILGVSRLTPRRIPLFVSRLLEFTDSILDKVGLYEINLHVGGEMSRTIAVSIKKSKEELGWEPRPGGLREGLGEAITFAKRNGNL